jgi:hypothetical protein
MANFEEIVQKHVGEDGGIPPKAIATLVSAIKTAVGNEFVDKERYKAKLTEIEELKEGKQTAEDSVATAEKWKTKYEGIKQELADYKKSVQTKETRAQKTDAYKSLLKEIGVNDKRIAAILKVTDLDGMELDADGKLKDAADLRKTAKEEWSDFIVTTHTQGAQTATPPSGKVAPKSREEIMKIKDPTERQKEWGAYLAAQKG